MLVEGTFILLGTLMPRDEPRPSVYDMDSIICETTNPRYLAGRWHEFDYRCWTFQLPTLRGTIHGPEIWGDDTLKDDERSKGR